MDNKKKITLIVIGIVEAIVLVFCLVISIMVLQNYDAVNTGNNITNNGAFIGGLQNNHILFFCTIVLPVFVIFLADGAYLIVYANKKASLLSDNEKKTIEDEAKRQAREEVLKEMQAEQSEQKEQADKPLEAKSEEPKK
jgi:hypothetical protein